MAQTTLEPRSCRPQQGPIVQKSLCFASLIMVLIIIAIILSLLGNDIRLVHGDIGTATSYDPPYALSEGLSDNGAACGWRYRIRCLSGNNKPCKDGTVDVRVVDFCPRRPCPATIIMSNDAFAAISNSPDAKINVEFIQYKKKHTLLSVLPLSCFPYSSSCNI
ncbi:unnamed protein product [Ilex paraguariensis]|uniref:Expansin-like EG45 domain-containing protein n=1 Tax=Ilex paraguariensis TaxID=185542 RepID=A0ABC8TDT3_9AQUA